MEQLDQQKGAVQPPELTGDASRISQGIAAAHAEGRELDDATARRIAAHLHGGQASALYSLASAGAIDEEGVYHELSSEYEQQRDPEIKEWINWLGTYCLRRENKGPVNGWHELTKDEKPGQVAAVGGVALNGAQQETSQAHETEANEWKPPVQIWVASLTDYNNGRLHGVWVDADQDPEERLHAQELPLPWRGRGVGRLRLRRLPPRPGRPAR